MITDEQLRHWRVLAEGATPVMGEMPSYKAVELADVPLLLAEVERLRAALREACEMVRVGHDSVRLVELEKLARSDHS